MIEHISYRQGLTLVKGMKSILMEIPLDKEKFGLSRLMCAPQLYAHLEFKSNNIHRLNQFGLSFKPGAEIFPTSFTFIFIEIDSLYLACKLLQGIFWTKSLTLFTTSTMCVVANGPAPSQQPLKLVMWQQEISPQAVATFIVDLSSLLLAGISRSINWFYMFVSFF